MTRIMRKSSNGFEEIFNSGAIDDLTRRIETLESNWNSVDNSHLSPISGVHMFRRWKIVCMTWYFSKTITANAFTEFFTMPSGWRPSTSMYFGVEISGQCGRLYINNQSGRVALYSFVNSNQTQGTVCFAIP